MLAILFPNANNHTSQISKTKIPKLFAIIAPMAGNDSVHNVSDYNVLLMTAIIISNITTMFQLLATILFLMVAFLVVEWSTTTFVMLATI